MVSGGVADCHPERVAALAAALGPARLGELVAHFRADLAALVAAADTLDAPALRQWAHRLHGSGSTLGFDAAAAALAAAAEAGRPVAALAALGEAEAALTRGVQQLSDLPGLGAFAQAPETSKR
jgi:HPt (histidine-containing phosphotransfer) domain-containing protein